ncbi:TPA: hypothetical protein OL592_004985 [Escherichia coli]|nr:hypothetical protein [Escherichia coli]
MASISIRCPSCSATAYYREGDR